MKILEAYKKGFITSVKSKKMITIIYAITLILALVPAVAFRKTLIKIAGNSMSLDQMVKGFDFTTYADFLRTAGYSISPFFTMAIWLGIFYLFFTVFFSGGVLKILDEKNNKFSAGAFFENCAIYFPRFLRLSIYLFILQLVFAIVVFMPLKKIISIASKTVQSEASIFYIAVVGIIIYLIIFMLILTIGDYAKIILFKNESRKSLRSIWLSAKFVLKNFLSAYSLYLILLIAPVFLFLIYFFLDNNIGMVSGISIFIMFLIQQALIWVRIMIKIWVLGSEFSFYQFLNVKPLNNEEEDIKLAGIGNEILDDPLPS